MKKIDERKQREIDEAKAKLDGADKVWNGFRINSLSPESAVPCIGIPFIENKCISKLVSCNI